MPTQEEELTTTLQTLLAIRSWLIGPDYPPYDEQSPVPRDNPAFAAESLAVIEAIDASIFVDGDFHPLLKQQ